MTQLTREGRALLTREGRALLTREDRALLTRECRALLTREGRALSRPQTGRSPSLRFLAVTFTALALFAGAAFAEGPGWAKPDLVARVAAGELTEANVSWWGYDAADATRFVQAALDSKARKVVLDEPRGTWFVRPLKGRSDLTFVIPKGVTLQAKRGEYKGRNDCLFTVRAAHDVTLTGGGTLRMWFDDYTNRTAYCFSEWRHAVSVLSSSRVTVENLTLAESGGDGVYLGNCADRPNCDIVLRDLNIVRNNRQGISVITADRLLIERCILADTCGTAPLAGIDFEPNRADEMLRDIVMRDCVARNNAGAGFDFAVFQLQADSTPISILMDNCRSEGNAAPVRFSSAADPFTGFRGEIKFRNCLFEDGPHSCDRLRIAGGKQTMAVSFEKCRGRLADGTLGEVDGETWGWKSIPRVKWPDGSLITATPITAETFRSARVTDAKPGETVKLAAIPIRGKGDYYVYAAAKGPVRLKGYVRRVGRKEFKDFPITVFALNGRRVATVKGPTAFDKPAEITFAAPKPGFYRLQVVVGNNHAFNFTETDAPIALAPLKGKKMPGLHAKGGKMYLNVTGRKRFAVVASGEHGVELFRFRLQDPTGACVMDVDNVVSEYHFSPASPAPGLWTLTASQPSKGCFEDYSIGVYGVPCFLFLSPEKTWTLFSPSASAAEPVRLWAGETYPTLAQLERAKGVRFSTIKRHEPEKDGFDWLHGVGLCWHGNRLYASYGTNPGKENTAGECCMCRYSGDDGLTWSEPQLIDAGEPSVGLAVSHGVLLSKNGRLYSFMGAFTNDMTAVHTRLSVLEPGATAWTRVGVVVGGGFWPMQPPVKMVDGNWIMGGLRCAKGLKDAKGGNRPAVAISEGDELTKWHLVVIDRGAVSNCWGEATVDVCGPFVTLVSRPGWKNLPSVAWVATSADCGRSWTELRPTNLPMVTAKPYTGRLSDGRRYAVNSMTADGKWARNSMVLATSRPGEWAYSQVRLVHCTDDLAPDARGKKARLMSYPAAVERDGKLYIGYSVGFGVNRNSAELAIVPLK